MFTCKESVSRTLDLEFVAQVPFASFDLPPLASAKFLTDLKLSNSAMTPVLSCQSACHHVTSFSFILALSVKLTAGSPGRLNLSPELLSSSHRLAPSVLSVAGTLSGF